MHKTPEKPIKKKSKKNDYTVNKVKTWNSTSPVMNDQRDYL